MGPLARPAFSDRVIDEVLGDADEFVAMAEMPRMVIAAEPADVNERAGRT